MSRIKIISIGAVIALGAVAAQAQEVIRIAVPDNVAQSRPSVSRAEVLADLHMWRLSGLQDLTRGESGPNYHGEEFREAKARYEWLRASPQFATLVAELSRNPRAVVVAERADPSMASTTR